MTDLASAFERAAIVRQRLAVFAGRAGGDLGNSVGIGLDHEDKPTVTMPLELLERLLTAAEAPPPPVAVAVEQPEPTRGLSALEPLDAADHCAALMGKPASIVDARTGAHVVGVVEHVLLEGPHGPHVSLALEGAGSHRIPLDCIAAVGPCND